MPSSKATAKIYIIEWSNVSLLALGSIFWGSFAPVPITIWRSIKTHEDKKWTKRYHDSNPRKKAFGAKVIITLKNGKKITEEQGVADAHPYGARPFKRKNYINKFLTLTENILDKKESNRFLKTVQNLKKLKSGQLNKLNIEIKKSKLKRNLKKGIF